MRAGKLRHRIRIQRMTITHDELGDEKPTWTPLTSCRANVQMMRGDETFRTARMQEGATVTHRIVMRYRGDVRPDDRILYGDRILDILNVGDPDGRCRTLLIKAQEHVGEVDSKIFGTPAGFIFNDAANSHYLGVL